MARMVTDYMSIMIGLLWGGGLGRDVDKNESLQWTVHLPTCCSS